LNPKSRAGNIKKYRDEIGVAYPQIPDFQVVLHKFGLTLTPWENWNSPDGVPDWWTAYNKIKHHRHSEYHRGNLQNALNAVAGLYVMVLYLYKEKAEEAELVPSPQLFRPVEEHFVGTTFGGYEVGIQYEL
jgi:hypothetical protein